MKTQRIELVRGDITKMNVDAIVNAANGSLAGGGGVDGAIHRAAGPKLHEECMEIIRKIGRCQTGEAVITSAGNMQARSVIHTVGPVWRDGQHGEPALLVSAYRNSLALAAKNGIKTIAFPNISTGIYGYPKLEAAQTAVKEVLSFLETNNSIERVIFVCFDDENFEIYKGLMGE
jgi:O-acetyl-ADP-ribose deacetylase (regulator of RNase III)